MWWREVWDELLPVQRIWLMPMISPFIRKRATIQQKQDWFMAGRTGWSHLLCDIAISKGLCFYHGRHGTAFYGARLCSPKFEWRVEMEWKSRILWGRCEWIFRQVRRVTDSTTWLISGNLSHLSPVKSVDWGVPLPYPGLTAFSFSSNSVRQ